MLARLRRAGRVPGGIPAPRLRGKSDSRPLDAFNAIEFNDVAFVFGTGAGDATVLVPLPMALPMGLAGLLGVVIFRRRK